MPGVITPFSNEFGILSNFYKLADDIQKNMELNERTANFIKIMVGEEDAHSKTLNTLSRYTDSQVAAVYLRNDNNSQFEHFCIDSSICRPGSI